MTVRYHVAVGFSRNDDDAAYEHLATQVNELLSSGWELQGGVAVHVGVFGNERQTHLAQAMVRRTV